MRIVSYLGVLPRLSGRVFTHCMISLSAIVLAIFISQSLLKYIYGPHTSANPSTVGYNYFAQTPTTQKIILRKERSELIYQPPPTSRILRAILIFYPNDQEDTFKMEFRWLYLSWTEMMVKEPKLWRTDLIVFASQYISLFKTLDCAYDEIRQNPEERPRCRVFPYTRVKSRQKNHKPSSKYQTIDSSISERLYQSLKSYGYIDSINSAFEYYLSYSMYNFIIRTDMDCFLTHNFGTYVPFDNSLLVGHGGYSTEFNNKRLKRIARDMNWQYADRNSLGSTWYGSPTMANRLANFTIQAMIYLNLNEFTMPEREQKLGVILWPEWHYGVLLLYGGHLAINHLTASEDFDVGLADQLLDQGVTAKDKNDIEKNKRLHLHCWHGNEPFSKFDFKAGKYNDIDPSTLVSDTSASGLAMRVALQANSMSLDQLKQKLLDVKK